MKISSAFTFHLNHAIEQGLVCVGKCESTCFAGLDVYAEDIYAERNSCRARTSSH